MCVLFKHYISLLSKYIVKVKLSLGLTMYHAMKTNGEVKVQFHTFLTSALDGGEWSATCPVLFTPGDSPQYPLDRRLGGPESWSEHIDKEKNSHPLQESDPGCLAHSLIA
jgi:hypothetical protein